MNYSLLPPARNFEDVYSQIEEIGQLETSVVIAVKKNSSIAPLDYKKEIALKR